MTTPPPRKAVAPPPLVACGRSAIWCQAPEVVSKQSARPVVGARPPATQTLLPSTKPDTWFRGTGSDGSVAHALVAGSYTSAGPTLPAPALPPIAYSLPWAASSACPPRAQRI